jgi:methylenetetrahydrofolate dehydrogenase (NADP+)/methenyltetrahydrofolate cyclohydrolase
MAAKIIDGQALANTIIKELGPQIAELKAGGRAPHLVAVQVGENAASRVYVRNQEKCCQEAGVSYALLELPAETTTEALTARIEQLNADPKVTGIILQMPLPQGINAREMQWKIAPHKDVEGMNPANMGYVVYGRPRLAPCTAMAVFELVKFSGAEIKGAEVCLVGHSEIVGKPATMLLLDAFGTTTTCHIATRDVKSHTKLADILIVAVGKAGLIKADMIKPGATVIDVGINRVNVVDAAGQPVLDDKGKPKKKTVGDVEFEAACQVAGAITPVPGGVGQVTTAILLRNTVTAAQLQASA